MDTSVAATGYSVKPVNMNNMLIEKRPERNIRIMQHQSKEDRLTVSGHYMFKNSSQNAVDIDFAGKDNTNLPTGERY